VRKATQSIGAFLQAMKTAYADTVSNYVTAAVKTTRGRIGLALVILAVALSTGFRIIGSAFMEEEPVVRVLSVWAAALWLFGFGYSAAIILRPVLKPARERSRE
jgi:hypothetical protein